MLYFSIVVPVYSGEAYLHKLINEIEALADRFSAEGWPIQLGEVIFVLDQAKDNSGRVLESLAESRPWMVLLTLSKNFGQHPATVAGILHSSGDWVITMDEDMQHPPNKIPEMLSAAVNAGADLAYGKSENPVHKSFLKDSISQSFKKLVSVLAGNKNLNKISSFRLIRGSVARAASSICGHDTYFDVALQWFTDAVVTVPMKLQDQRHIKEGKSGYRFRSLLSHARRLLFSSHLKILRVGTLLGFFVVLLSLCSSFLLLLIKTVYPESIQVQGWTSLMLSQTFLGGMMLLLLGIVLEYLSILVLRAHGKPLFFIVDRKVDRELAVFFDGNE